MDFDAIIIGTGFGATVAATQLVKKNKRVLMLERGLWWYSPERPLPDYIKQRSQKQNGELPEQPVQYWPRPDHRDGLANFLSIVRTNAVLGALQQIGGTIIEELFGDTQPDPLYRYHMFDDIHIITASGVGGGSLVYSNVTIEPHWDGNRYPVMDGWALPLGQNDYNNARGWMDKYRGTRSQVVTKIPLPHELNLDVANLDQDHEFLYLGKSRALRYATEKMAQENAWKQQIVKKWAPLDLQVIEYDGVKNPDQSLTDAGSSKTFCERQGRCFIGCLPGARHTLNKTLLRPDLNLLVGQNPLVTLKSLVEVNSIEPLAGGGYKVLYRDRRDDSKLSVTAPVVVLAAGCLGSTHLLLKSDKLTLSTKLGSRFSSNGDFSAFAVIPQDPDPVNNPLYPIFPTRGPINTSHVMFSDGRMYVNIEDGAIPSMFAALTRAALDVLDNAANRDPFISALRGLWAAGRLPNLYDPKRAQTEHEMLAHVFFFNCMGTDGARGQFSLDGQGELTLKFAGGSLANEPVFAKIEEICKAIAERMRGHYVAFPLWRGFDDLIGRKALSVHPLGGCPMGRTSDDGVVNTQGQVFNTQSGANTVYDGLYVADASVIPGPLAVNPTLTIVAYALKIAAAIP